MRLGNVPLTSNPFDRDRARLLLSDPNGQFRKGADSETLCGCYCQQADYPSVGGSRNRRYDRTKGVQVYQTNQKTSLRSALLLGAVSAAAIGLSAPAMAQDGAVETVVVTGSRIPQQGLYASSPVTAIGQQEIKFEGTTDVGSLVNNLPSVFAGQTSFTGNASTGTATVDLRGLGAQRTLVLIDGKRLGPGDPVVPVADLNQIPAAMIDHVEVLTGGASAVYGSDALAGVVNFIMRKDFEGIEIDGTYSVNSHTNNNSRARGYVGAAGYAQAPKSVLDGGTVDSTLIMGVNSADGKGNITAYFGYRNVQGVLAGKRDYSACALNSGDTNGDGIDDSLSCGGSANYSLFVPTTGPGATGPAGGYYFMKPGGAMEPFTSQGYQYYNYGPVNSTQRPDTRYTAGAFGHYQVDPMLDVYANFMFTDDHTKWQAAPSALFFGAAASPSGQFTVNCDNPLAAGTDFQTKLCSGPGQKTVKGFFTHRNIEGGPRVTDFRHTTYRIVLGAKGDLGDGWAYDVSGQFSTSLYNELYLHDLSASRTQDALNAVSDGAGGAVCASGNSGCVPLDLFHGIGGFTPAMLDYIYANGQQSGSTEERILTGSVTGDLGQYGIKSPWASQGVGIALGSEYRSEYLELQTSDADKGFDLMGAGGANPGQPRSGFSVVEGFGEVQVPLVQNQPFFQDLSLNAGYRYSSYSSSGRATSYKYGAEWQPIDDIRVRGSFQRAVRAPNVLELFSPQSALLGSFEDPCGGAAPTATAAQCANTGVTAAQYGHIVQCPASQCKILTGGNTTLRPETSDTKSFGVVLTPTFLEGFTATIDYFDIKVNNSIGVVPATIALQQCVAGTNLALCPLIKRDGAGTIATNTGYVINTNTNTGYLATKGIDFEANYTTALDNWGMGETGALSVSFLGTYVDSATAQPYTGATAKDASGKVFKDYDCVGLYGTTCGVPTPEWRHKMRVTWSSPWDFNLSVAWRHMSAVTFDGNNANPFLGTGTPVANAGAGGAIGSYDYFDLAGSWTVSQGVSLRAGVNNVFDKDPPILASGGTTSGPTGPLNGNTFPGVYDPLGRYLYIGGTLKL